MRKFIPLVCVGLLAFGIFNITQAAAKKFTIFYACDAEPGSGNGEPDGMAIVNHSQGNNLPGDNGKSVLQLVMANFEPNQLYDIEMVHPTFGSLWGFGIPTDDKGQATYHTQVPLVDLTEVTVINLHVGTELRASTTASTCP